jgi:hypothetical protein
MSSALDYINIRAPELANYPNIEAYIVASSAQTGNFSSTPIPGATYTKKDIAIALRALHMITRKINLDNAGGQGQTVGFVTQASEGEISVSTAVDPIAQKRFGDLVTTTWGVELISLIKSSFMFSGITRVAL